MAATGTFEEFLKSSESPPSGGTFADFLAESEKQPSRDRGVRGMEFLGGTPPGPPEAPKVIVERVPEDQSDRSQPVRVMGQRDFDVPDYGIKVEGFQRTVPTGIAPFAHGTWPDKATPPVPYRGYDPTEDLKAGAQASISGITDVFTGPADVLYPARSASGKTRTELAHEAVQEAFPVTEQNLIDPDAAQKVARSFIQGVGATPGMVAKYGIGTAMVGGNPILGMGVVDLLAASAEPDATPLTALKAGAKGALLGKVLGVVSKFPAASHVPLNAVIGGALAYADTQDVKEAIASALTMGVLSASHGIKADRVKDFTATPAEWIEFAKRLDEILRERNQPIDAGPVRKGLAKTAEESAVILAGAFPTSIKSARESAKVIGRTLDTREAQARAKAEKEAVRVPETGTPEGVARGVADRDSLATQLTGKWFKDLSPTDQRIVDDLIAEINAGRGTRAAPAPPVEPAKPAEAPLVPRTEPQPPAIEAVAARPPIEAARIPTGPGAAQAAPPPALSSQPQAPPQAAPGPAAAPVRSAPVPVSMEGLPPVPPGMVRVYRGEMSPDAPKAPIPEWIQDAAKYDPKVQASVAAAGRWATEDPTIAQWYVNDAGERGRLTYQDIPAEIVEASRVGNIPEARRFSADPDNELFLPPEYAKKGTPISSTSTPALPAGKEAIQPESPRPQAEGAGVPVAEQAAILRNMPEALLAEEFRRPAAQQRYDFNTLLAEAERRGVTLEGVAPPRPTPATIPAAEAQAPAVAAEAPQAPPSNLDRFMEAYERNLRAAIENNTGDVTYGLDKVTSAVKRMRASFERGSYATSKIINQTQREFRISTTAGLKSWLKKGPAPEGTVTPSGATVTSTKVEIPKKDVIAEHERLTKVLEEGTPAQQKAEAAKQEKELEEVKRVDEGPFKGEEVAPASKAIEEYVSSRESGPFSKAVSEHGQAEQRFVELLNAENPDKVALKVAAAEVDRLAEPLKGQVGWLSTTAKEIAADQGKTVAGMEFTPPVNPLRAAAEKHLEIVGEQAKRDAETAAANKRKLERLRAERAPKPAAEAKATMEKTTSESPVTISAFHQRHAEMVKPVKYELERAQARGVPAFVMDQELYRAGDKAVWDEKSGQFKTSHPLTKRGFENALEHYFDGKGEWSSFNKVAADRVAKLRTEREEATRSAEAKAEVERAESRRVGEEAAAKSDAIRKEVEAQVVGAKFKREKAPVKLRDKTIEIEGQSIGGLSVHRMVDVNGKPLGKGYSVTHIQSGLRVMELDTAKDARIAAVRLSKLADFTKPVKDLNLDIVRLAAQAMNREGAYAEFPPPPTKPPAPFGSERGSISLKPISNQPNITSPNFEKSRPNVLKHMDVSPAEKGEMSSIIDKWEAENPGRKAVTFQEIRDQAKAIAPELVKYLTPPRYGETLNPAVQYAGKMRVAFLNEQRVTQSIEFEKTKHTLSPAEQMDHVRKQEAMENDIKGILSILFPARSQDGRNLTYHRMMTNATWDESYWIGRARRAMGLPPGVDLPEPKRQAILQTIGEGRAAETEVLGRVRSQRKPVAVEGGREAKVEAGRKALIARLKDTLKGKRQTADPISDIERKLGEEDPEVLDLRDAIVAKQTAEHVPVTPGMRVERGVKRTVSALEDKLAGKVTPESEWKLTSEERKAVDSDPRVMAQRANLAEQLMKLDRSGLLETISLIRKAGLLTGLKTSARNVGGNTTFQFLEEASRMPASLIDIAISVGTHQRTVQGVNLRAFAHAAYVASTKGVREGIDVMRKGNTDVEMGKFEAFRKVNTGSWVLDAYLETVFNFQSAQDRVTKRFAIERSLQEQARLMELNGAGNEENLYAHPTAEMQLRAISDAEYATFNNKNPLATGWNVARGIMKAHGVGGELGAFAMDMVVPFARTPSNIAFRVLDYTPLGPLGRVPVAIARAMKAGKLTAEQQRIISMSIGRGMVGTAIIYLGAKFGVDGVMTGIRPDDVAERASDEAVGRIPGAMLLWGKWRQVAPFSPLGNLLTIGASIAETATKPLKDELKRPWLYASIGGQTVLEQPYLKGLNDVIEGLKTRSESGRATGIASSMAGSFVPTVISDVAASKDTVRRQPQGIMEGIKVRVPGLRQDVPEKVDVLGRTLEQTPWSAIDPTIGVAARELTDPLAKEIVRTQVNIGRTAKLSGTIEVDGRTITIPTESREEHAAHAKLAGILIERVASKVVQSERYQGLQSTDVRRLVIQKAIAHARNELSRVTSDKRFKMLPSEKREAIFKVLLDKLTGQEGTP